jgi:type I restriction enzyme S subunit
MSEWKITTLGQEVDLLTGNPFKSAQYTDDEGDILLLRGDNIGQGFLRWENAKRWSTEKIEGIEDYFLQKTMLYLQWIVPGLKQA